MLSFNATLFIVMASFIVFMMAMKAVYFDPILRIKREREAKLSGDRESAVRFAQEYERLYADYEAELKKARKDAHQAIQEIRQRAKGEAQELTQSARRSAQEETDQRMEEMAQWREETYQQLAKERESLMQAIIAKVTAGNKVGMASGG